MMMTQMQKTNFVQYGVRLLGLVYLGLGVLGFLPFDVLNPHHPEGVGARYLLNLIAVNTLHNVIHLAIGVSGLWAAQQLHPSHPLRGARVRLWGTLTGVVLMVLFSVGLAQAALEGFPKDQLLLRALPLNSPGHILHLISGGLALYLGLASPSSRTPGGRLNKIERS
jgi:hypothetical protein